MDILGNVAGKLSNNFQSTKEKLEQISNVLRKVPDILVFSFSGKKTNNLPKIKSDNFRLYIGQIFTDGRGLYDEEFLIGSIKTYLEKLEYGENLIIENSSIVSWIVNGLREDDNAISSNEQVVYLEQIINKYFPKQKSRIIISKIEDSHKELLSTIEKKGLEGLKSDENIGLNKNFTSLDIAKLLYKASQKNDNFFTRLVSTMKKRKGVEYNKNDLESYYTLIEIAIRLTDFVKGISIQGGEARQSLYDHIIIDILNGNFDEITELKTIKNFCLYTAKIPFFRTLNFSKEKYKQEQERQEQEKIFKNKTNKIAIPTALLVTALIGGQIKSTYDDYTKEQALDERINAVLVEALKDKTIFTYFKPAWGAKYETDKEKIHYLDETGWTLVKLFKSRYGEGDASDKELKLFFIGEMIELMSFPFYEDMTGEESYIKFIERVLQIPRVKRELISMGFNVDNNYLKYEKYKQAFSTTYNYSGNLNQTSKLDFASNTLEYIDSKGTIYQVEIHTCKTTWPSIPSNGCLISQNVGDNYILASKWNYGDYNLKDGKKVALDFLSSPYNRLIQKIIITGTTFGDNFFNLEDDIRKKIVDLVIEKKYSEEEIKSWETEDIIIFLQNNFKEHLNTDFKEIAANTLNLDEKTINELSKHKGNFFTTKIGKIKIGVIDYSINIFEFKGKKYFYLDFGNYNNGEGLNLYGFKVDNDDTTKFLQDLLEKLNK
nr:hypothetical protein [Candidatus Gracilibacteria bacterium]